MKIRNKGKVVFLFEYTWNYKIMSHLEGIRLTVGTRGAFEA